MSRIKEKLENRRRRESREEPRAGAPEVQASHASAALSPAASLPAVSPLSAPRPPTPEYGVDDVQKPLPETVVSPLSPASSPDFPGAPKATTIPRKAVGAPGGQLRHAKSTPSLKSETSNPGLAAPPPPPPPPVGLPTSPAPDRERGANQVQPLSARTSSSSGDDGRPAAGVTPREPPPSADLHGSHRRDPWSRSPTRERERKPTPETGSIDTLRPPFRRPDHGLAIEEELPLREPDPNQPDTTDNPGAALFPRNWYTPLPADTILDARPLTDRHFRCLTGHRYMTANRQRTNPIACRTCGHKDRNAECYICSACHLNVCSGCSGLLRRFRGDLRQVLQHVEERNKARPEFAPVPESAEESATAAILED